MRNPAPVTKVLLPTRSRYRQVIRIEDLSKISTVINAMVNVVIRMVLNFFC